MFTSSNLRTTEYFKMAVQQWSLSWAKRINLHHGIMFGGPRVAQSVQWTGYDLDNQEMGVWFPTDQKLNLFVAKNKNKLKMNSNVYKINSRQKFNFHQTLSNLSLYQKGIYSFSIQVFNNLPSSIRSLTDNITRFKSALKSSICSFLLLCRYIFNVTREC
jgi:hypothetical protein